MSVRSNQRYEPRDIGIVAVGILAGGVTALITDGIVPPTVVMGVALVVIAIEARRSERSA